MPLSEPRKWTCIHLSDIHFRTKRANGEAVLNADIRDQLIKDVSRLTQEGQTFNAVLVSGDLAFSGKPAEYEDARKFLDNVCEAAEIEATEVWMVPGNHDVDRSLIQFGTKQWHQRIKNPQAWNRQDILDEVVHLDEDQKRELLLGSLVNYNHFASQYGCATALEPLLYWEAPMSIELDGGFILKVRGLNSAFLCNETDQPGPTVMVGRQQALMREEPNVISLVMCHHPENWLADGGDLLRTLRLRAHIAFFGHEHAADVKNLNGLLVLHAGAVNPEAVEHTTASYNVLSIWVDKTNQLHAEVQRRIYSHERLRFVTHHFDGDAKIFNHLHQLPDAPHRFLPASAPSTLNSGGEANPVTPPDISEENLKRRLTFYLFELNEGARIAVVKELDLITDEMEYLSGRELFLAIIESAHQQGKLAELWHAVASRNRAMPPEPVSGTHHA